MKKKCTLLLALVMACTALLGIIPAFAAIGSSSGSMSAGQTETLELTGFKLISATSSNTSIVTVSEVSSDGTVTIKAVAEGSATITTYYYDSSNTRNTYYWYITVTGSALTVNLENIGDIDKSAEVYESVVQYKSSDTKVATVEFDGGQVVITAVGPGTCTVTYKGYRNDAWSTVTITVNVSGGLSAFTDGEAIALDVGDSSEVTEAYYEVTYTRSDNDKVAAISVDSSKRIVVNALSVGETYIYYTCRESATGELQTIRRKVTVTANTVKTSDPILIKVGEERNNSYNTVVSATSSNTSAVSATANSAKTEVTIKGKAKGTSTVTIVYKNSSDGVEKTIKIPVVVAGSVNSETMGIYLGKSTTLELILSEGTKELSGIKLNGTEVSASKLFWTSSDSEVISVDSSTGKFETVSVGTARLIAVDSTGTYMNYIDITVIDE